MGLTDLVAQPGQKIAYLFPEIPFSPVSGNGGSQDVTSGLQPNAALSSKELQDVFVFQFWPQQVTDRYQVNYATKSIPGASHPLYQWTGGGGRTISFDAQFVTELAEDTSGTTTQVGFNARIQADTGVLGGAAVTAVGNAITAGLLPSSRYIVDVAAALASLQRYLYGTYPSTGTGTAGLIQPPRKLVLVLPGTSLGRSKANDGILCILKSADVTMESFFPSGEIRSATVSLEFAEIIQRTVGQGTKITYIGAEKYSSLAGNYTMNGRGFSSVNL
jgi:hypothetical protein